jgi:hypothetical protein
VSRLGLKPLRLSLLQAEEPLRLKPSVRVFEAFSSFDYTASFVAPPYDLANPFSHPFIDISHGAGHAEFEVAQPSPQDRIDLDYDARNASTASLRITGSVGHRF